MVYLARIDEDLQDIICRTPVLIVEAKAGLLKEKATTTTTTRQFSEYQSDLEKQVNMETIHENATHDRVVKTVGRKPLQIDEKERHLRVKAQNKARKQRERERRRIAMTQLLFEENTN